MTAVGRALAPTRRIMDSGATGSAAGIRWAGPPAVAAGGLVFAALLAWMTVGDALRTALLGSGMTAAGMLLVRASGLQTPSVVASGTLALVLGAAATSLAAIALAFLGIPISSASVVIAVLATVFGAAVVLYIRPSSVHRAVQWEAAAQDDRIPSRMAIACCMAISAVALFAIPVGVHRITLLLYAGALGWVLWSASVYGNEGPARPAAAGWRATPLLIRLLPLALLALLLASRLAPFERSPVPLGYDTGLYRAVQMEFSSAMPAMPAFAPGSWADVQPPGLFVLSALLSMAGASPDAQLWGLLILVQLIGAVGIWLLAFDAGGRRAANWALALFVLSSAQYMLFYQVYFKQILALALLPYVLWLWRRESRLAIPVGVFLAATHSMGFLLLGLILFSDTIGTVRVHPLLRNLRETLAARRYHIATGISILVLGLASYAFAPQAITSFLSLDPQQALGRFGIGADASAGSYRIDGGYYALLILPLIPFATLGLIEGWRDPGMRLVVLWALWAGVFVVLDLIFARRFIGSLDPALIVLAAVSIARLTSGRLGTQIRPFAAIAVLSAAFFLARTIYDERPAIPIEDLRDLQVATQGLPGDAYLLAVSSADAPWVRGYGGRDTIAPGLFEHNRWTQEEWQTFWAPTTPQQRYALLAQYDRPIYAFMRADMPFPSIVDDPQFERVSRTLWRYTPERASAEQHSPSPSGPPGLSSAALE